jgi:hypothetical protein
MYKLKIVEVLQASAFYLPNFMLNWVKNSI